MLAADRILTSVGPGERGGRIVFDGTVGELRRAPRSRASTGRTSIGTGLKRLVTDSTPRLILRRASTTCKPDGGVSLQRLVTVTGVSNRTEIHADQDVLAPASCTTLRLGDRFAGALTAAGRPPESDVKSFVD